MQTPTARTETVMGPAQLDVPASINTTAQSWVFRQRPDACPIRLRILRIRCNGNYHVTFNIDDGSCLVPSEPCIVFLDGDGVCGRVRTQLAEAEEATSSCLHIGRRRPLNRRTVGLCDFLPGRPQSRWRHCHWRPVGPALKRFSAALSRKLGGWRMALSLPAHTVAIAQLVRALDCGSRGRRFEPD